MGYLRCQQCRRIVYSANYKNIGLKCGAHNCSGLLEFMGSYYVTSSPSAKLDLKCTKCGSVFSSAATGKKIFGECPIKSCDGRLDRFWG